ncbi:GHKL domain-containing protein [Carnobacterium gallinarum]|uniref:GHKL domain-containing protein n=1 Tax=Carnobacterium gallinarum TaxID=2749 RepID=UPI00147029A7
MSKTSVLLLFYSTYSCKFGTYSKNHPYFTTKIKKANHGFGLKNIEKVVKNIKDILKFNKPLPNLNCVFLLKTTKKCVWLENDKI